MNREKRIVIINGGAGVGKDTFCRLCGKYVSATTVSTVDPIKGIFSLCGIPYNKFDKDRKALSDMKDILDRYDYTHTYIGTYVNTFLNTESIRQVLFVHMRDPADIQWLCYLHPDKVITLLIRRTDVPRVTNNHADLNVEDFQYDWIIDNDLMEDPSLPELDRKAYYFVSRAVYQQDDSVCDCPLPVVRIEGKTLHI